MKQQAFSNKNNLREPIKRMIEKRNISQNFTTFVLSAYLIGQFFNYGSYSYFEVSNGKLRCKIKPTG